MPEVLQQMLNYVIAIYIRLSAEETAALEEAAKHLPGKNAVALFTPERKAVRDAKGNLLVQPEQGHIYAWDVFRINSTIRETILN